MRGWWEPHTSYPVLRHHSIISGIACLFMPRPDFRMASTMEKLDCSVFSAATAACTRQRRPQSPPWRGM